MKREQIRGGRRTGKRKREIGQGSGWLTAVTSNKQRAGQAPEGDISLQLCRDLLLFTVLCATAGLHFTLANGFIGPTAGALKEAVFGGETPGFFFRRMHM